MCYHFRTWAHAGTEERLHPALRRPVRAKAGRDPEPRLAIADRHSGKTTEGGGERGLDGGKLVTGRKRPALVETLG